MTISSIHSMVCMLCPMFGAQANRRTFLQQNPPLLFSFSRIQAYNSRSITFHGL
jgi:hypothetical protein